MSNSKLALIILFLVFATRVDAFRIPRPDQFSLPWDEEQMKKHNDAHEDLWNLQNGEYNLDIVTTTKSGAQNGDFWFIQTGSTVYLQFRANNHTFTITPDGW